MRVDIASEGLLVSTRGLDRLDHQELRVQVSQEGLIPGAEDFLRHVVQYVEAGNVRIQSGQTLAYGYWLTKFLTQSSSTLEVLEYNADATEFVPGATLTLTYWRDQNALCRRVSSPFRPPKPDQMAAVSAGVFEGGAVEGLRYSAPEHMSGWIFTTDEYSGDVNSLRIEHLYHLTAARPDLASYVALTPGIRFRISDEGKEEWIWFDQSLTT